MERCITHIFIGDKLEFLSRKFILRIVETSALVHQFVIFADDKSWPAWNDFFSDIGVQPNRFLLLRTYSRKTLWVFLCRVYDMFQLLVFSSAHILSHRRHYNLVLLWMIKLCGKNISFMSWGDIPRIAHGFQRIIQILRFKCYTMGLVQISSEEVKFKNLYHKLKITTRPYMRDNFKVLSLCDTSNRKRRCLLIGNNGWYYHLYGDILEQLNWSQWDKVICMLNYGNDARRAEIDEFCKRMEIYYGDKLVLWRKTFGFDEYLARIQDCSTYIFPAATQGGIDLAYNMLLLGKRVICRGVNYAWLRDIGCVVDDLDDIDLRQCGLLSPLLEKEVENNRRIVLKWTDMSRENINLWDQIYLEL